MMEKELRVKYPAFFEKYDTIFSESKKYNLIDRFFHFSIESINFTERINSLIAVDSYPYIKGELSCFGFEITNEIELLIEKIKNCYGLQDIDFHLESQRMIFLDNPNLLGISPFLFKQEDWRKIMLNEIDKFRHGEIHINELFKLIRDCLNETFERLQISKFSELQGYIHFYKGWDENIKTSEDLFLLIVDEFFENSQKLALNNVEQKKENEFLKSEMLKNSIQSKIVINSTFDFADKVFKKYFELTIPSEKHESIYLNFRRYLEILFNRSSIESKIELVGLNEEEVKRFIRFFWHYKSPNSNYNLFTYKVEDLIMFLERITGLNSKTSWDKAHRDIKFNIDKNTEKEINSIIE